ncbi:MAG: hypothetical protein J5367_04890 [Lachnospiraceae bacterium]|nr:hypothetical protein [Lachnospiraceae bacterium]
MKKITKLLVVSAILTMIFAMPVMAKEVSFASENTDYLITLLNGNAAKLNGALADFAKVQAGPNAQAVIANQTALVNSKIAAVNKECAENHITLLNGKVYNLKQIEATRLAQLNNFKSLLTMSNTWAPQVAAAQKEYDTAVAARVAAEQYLATAKVKLAPYM